MKIVIATKARSNDQITLKAIFKSFTKEEIDLVVEPQDLKDYAKYERVANIVNLGANDKGIVYVRNWITQNYKGIIFILDDDLTEFRIRAGKNGKGYWKMRKMEGKEIRSCFLHIENFLKKNNDYVQATISYCKSNWLFDKNFKDITRVWAFKVNNNDIMQREGILIKDKAGTFEDYEQTLLGLSKGYKNRSFYNFGFNCVPMGTNKGGLHEERQRIVRDSVEHMKRIWGNEIVKEFWSEQHQPPEIKVNWKKAYGKNS